MAGDDPLYEPLGRIPSSGPRRSRRIALPVLICIGAIGAGALGWAAWHRPTHRDGAVAVATIEVAPKLAPAASPAPSASAAPPVAVVAAPPPSSPPGSTVEVQNGVKIIRFNPTASAASITVPVDRDSAGPLKAAPDPRVAETTDAGVLPRIAADGTRPAEVYARSAVTSLGPRVALLLVGMGADQIGTADAARRLDPDVSFGFGAAAPDAQAQVAESRRAGHEVFLDWPGSDDTAAPADVAPTTTVADIQHVLARFSGYAGVVLAAGASGRVTEEIGSRGLLAVQAAAGSLPAGEGRVVTIDGASSPGALANALEGLASLARQKGATLGIVTHGTRALDAVTAFTTKAAAQGVTLVPASHLLASKGGTAQVAQ